MSVCQYECSCHPTHWLQSILLSISSECMSITLSHAVSQCLCYEWIADVDTYVLVNSLAYTDHRYFTAGTLDGWASVGPRIVGNLYIIWKN